MLGYSLTCAIGSSILCANGPSKPSYRPRAWWAGSGLAPANSSTGSDVMARSANTTPGRPGDTARDSAVGTLSGKGGVPGRAPPDQGMQGSRDGRRPAAAARKTAGGEASLRLRSAPASGREGRFSRPRKCRCECQPPRRRHPRPATPTAPRRCARRAGGRDSPRPHRPLCTRR